MALGKFLFSGRDCGVGARDGKLNSSLFFSGWGKNPGLSEPVERYFRFSTESDQKDTLLLVLDERPGAARRAGALCIGDDEDQVRLGELFSVVNPGGAKHRRVKTVSKTGYFLL